MEKTEGKIRYGLIGIGAQGGSYARFLTNAPAPFPGMVCAPCPDNCALGALCDIDPEKEKMCKEQYPDVPFFKDWKDMIASGTVDAIITTVPHYLHHEISIYAMEHGMNVLCEKPAGVRSKDVQKMIACAKAHPEVSFGIMFNQRTNCVYRKMHEMVQSGKYGQIKRVNWIITDWYRTQAYYNSGGWRATWDGEGGGVLFNQCPHQLDLLQWIAGMKPERVRAFCRFGKWHDIEVEDDVTAYMEFPNGASGCFVTCTADAPGTNRLELTGTKGKLVYENNVITYWKLKTDEREFCKTAPGGFDQPACETQTVEIPAVEGSEHNRVLNNVANAILGLEPLYIDGKEGINGVALADAMLLSTWLDKTIEMPFDDDLYLAELDKRRATSRRKENVNEKTFSLDNSFSNK